MTGMIKNDITNSHKKTLDPLIPNTPTGVQGISGSNH